MKHRTSLAAASFLVALGSLAWSQAPLGRVAEAHPRPGPPWVVDDDGSADFTTLQAAIDAASSGDVVIVRSTNGIEHVVLDGKGLTLIGPGQSTSVLRRLTIRDVPSDESVVVRGFLLGPLRDGNFFQPAPPTVSVVGAAGPVWFEDCTVRYITGYSFSALAWQEGGVEVVDSDSVTLLSCDVGPQTPSTLITHDLPPPDRFALQAERSGLHAYDVSFLGPEGGGVLTGSIVTQAGDGGDGARLIDSFLFASGCRFEGGAGRSRPCLIEPEPVGNGGDGIEVLGSSEVHVLECELVAGLAGTGFSTQCLPGVDGEATVGPVDVLSGVGREYRVGPRRTRSGTLTLTASGPAGDLVLSVVAGEAGRAQYLPQHLGSQLLQPPYAFVVEGTIPASGTLTRSFDLPPLLLLPFEETYFQGFFFDAAGGAFLAGASAVVHTR